MNPFTKVWFWFLILSIIGFIVTIILFETNWQTTDTSWTSTTWIVFAISIVLFVFAFILFIIDISAYYRDRDIAEACGELIPCPKKKVECPKKCCVQKTIIECTELPPSSTCNPCEPKVIPYNPCKPCESKIVPYSAPVQMIPVSQIEQPMYIPVNQMGQPIYITDNNTHNGTDINHIIGNNTNISPINKQQIVYEKAPIIEDPFSAAELKPLASLTPPPPIVV